MNFFQVLTLAGVGFALAGPLASALAEPGYYGHRSYGHHGYGYGKREAEATPEADAEPGYYSHGPGYYQDNYNHSN